MKSNKITTYLLLVTAIIIWGTITWKVIKALRKEEVVTITPPLCTVVQKTDTAALLLNYEDPFLKDTGNKTEEEEEEEEEDFYDPNDSLYPSEPELVKGPAFKFKGTLKAGDKLYALLDLNGETIMVNKRETVGDFYIVSITVEKLIVRRQGIDMELFQE